MLQHLCFLSGAGTEEPQRRESEALRQPEEAALSGLTGDSTSPDV